MSSLDPAARAARDRTILWTRILLLIAAATLVAGMADLGDGHSWLERIGGVVLGAGSWVSCNVIANLVARPLSRAGWEATRTKVVTGVVLGLLMVLAAAGIAAWYGAWSALPVAGGWLAATALVSYAGLQSWSSALEGEGEQGQAMREILATQKPWAAPLDVVIAVVLAVGLGLMVAQLFTAWPWWAVLPAWPILTGSLSLLSGRGFGSA